MICTESEEVTRSLKDRDICLSPTNKWLNSCIIWFKSHEEIRHVYTSLNDYVTIQFLLADLQDVQHSCLPKTCATMRKTELNGKYCVQINWMRDIGQSSYSQLQAAQNITEAESNEFVSADEPKKQSWEPNPKRVLMMEVTDGETTLKAMEYSPIPKLDEPFLPGLKVLLSGPIECRNGILFLKNNNITILGGEVDHLHDVYSRENMLLKCLNLPVNSRASNVLQEGPENSAQVRPEVVYEPPNSPDLTAAAPARHHSEQLPDSTSTIDHNPIFVDDGDIMMATEDDDFLRELPDEILDHSANFYPEPSNNSPVTIDHQNHNNPFNETHRLEGTSFNPGLNKASTHSRAVNKPKLFPSLEDLSNLEQQSIPRKSPRKTPQEQKKEAPLFSISKQQTVNPRELQGSNSKLDVSESERKASVEKIVPRSTSCASEVRSRNESSSPVLQSHRTSLDLEEQKSDSEFPKQKTVQAKVDNLIKIKIRSSEWHCLADILADGQAVSVSFSNKVLDEVFGITATEVEVLREKMPGDEDLKSKVNKILKAGQAKLKTLNCPMTLEYSAEDCVPLVISIVLK